MKHNEQNEQNRRRKIKAKHLASREWQTRQRLIPKAEILKRNNAVLFLLAFQKNKQNSNRIKTKKLFHFFFVAFFASYPVCTLGHIVHKNKQKTINGF